MWSRAFDNGGWAVTDVGTITIGNRWALAADGWSMAFDNDGWAVAVMWSISVENRDVLLADV